MIIALVSRKGGVGKTTTTVSLSSALALAGARVLVVDLDSQASASLSLGVPRAELAPSSADLLLRGTPAPALVRPTSVPGLDLITASVDLVSADRELGPYQDRAQRLRTALEPVVERYDFIFLDCPPSLSVVPTAALAAADGFLVPVVPHFLALEGITNLLASASRIVDRRGVAPAPLGLILTMVDYRTKTARANVDRLRRRYGELVFAVEVRTNIQLAEAPETGQPIATYAPQSTGAKAYALLAEELLLRCRSRLGRPIALSSAARAAPLPAAAAASAATAVSSAPDEAPAVEAPSLEAPTAEAAADQDPTEESEPLPAGTNGPWR